MRPSATKLITHPHPAPPPPGLNQPCAPPATVRHVRTRPVAVSPMMGTPSIQATPVTRPRSAPPPHWPSPAGPPLHRRFPPRLQPDTPRGTRNRSRAGRHYSHFRAPPQEQKKRIR
ncbi:hypothetical protein CesoFtcFv8_022669 [Champsocephalus esox]|uniref:Uncharacterized protein n=1 Tax=Champsocephalus esox TaxID=159716 RepID=A0AAN8B6M8_9TELE|nr:hypothetical protein CesoFtcFv8_022669 [Champsocephalus esox]